MRAACRPRGPRRPARTGRALVVLAALAALVGPGPVGATLNEVDDVPAATLLLPYFEVDLDDPAGVNTFFSINNASATAILAHVTVWSDLAIPVLAFDVYLTGFDVQRVDLREVLRGRLPRTANPNQDPDDTISPQGSVSQDINFPFCDTVLPYPSSLGAATVAHVRASLTGQASAIFGDRCVGRNLGDGLARGYVTVDAVNSCSLIFPSDPGYLGFVTTDQNVLWGDYQYVDPRHGTAAGDALVHIEAAEPGFYVPGDYTFYGRYVAGTAADRREPLATTFAVPYVDRDRGRVREETHLAVWRDSKTSNPTSFACDATPPFPPGSPYPLNTTEIVGFDEAEAATDLLHPPFVVPPPPPDRLPFPVAAQKVRVGSEELPAPAEAGWIYVNLNTSTGSVLDPRAQGWITVLQDVGGRRGTGYRAIPLDSAGTP